MLEDLINAGSVVLRRYGTFKQWVTDARSRIHFEIFHDSHIMVLGQSRFWQAVSCFFFHKNAQTPFILLYDGSLPSTMTISSKTLREMAPRLFKFIIDIQ